MDLLILVFLTALSIVLFITAIIIGKWVQLGLGWIAGGLLLTIGLTIGNGEQITLNSLLSTDTITSTALDLGLSNENIMIVYALIGFMMIVAATFIKQ